MFERRKKGLRLPRIPKGMRSYAVGDVHGRLDLLRQLLAAIEEDTASRPQCEAVLIFLGDLIDRGPDSYGVVECLRNYRSAFIKPQFIAGNHEEVFLSLHDGESGVLQNWLRFGGAECLQSYGVSLAALDLSDEMAARAIIKAAIPSGHIEFIRSFCDQIKLGDYLFVHAGIRPGVDLSRQCSSDLRWIRSPFLGDKRDHGVVVVHGHTICAEVEFESNRIGIDTGAYFTGKLTALGLEGETRWLLTTK